MSHAKQASKRKRRRKVAPILGAAGLLSLAGGANAATEPVADLAEQNTGASHEMTLADEEIADVSLATFYVFDKETPAPGRSGLRLAMGACSGCGCGCFSCGACWTGTNYTSSVLGNSPPSQSAHKRVHALQQKHVPKNP